MGVTGTYLPHRPAAVDPPLDDFDRDFRSDWERNYRAARRYGYDRYQPAYQYGWQLGPRIRDATGTTSKPTPAPTGSATTLTTHGKTSSPPSARAGSASGRAGCRAGPAAWLAGAEQPYMGIEQGAQHRQVRGRDARLSRDATAWVRTTIGQGT